MSEPLPLFDTAVTPVTSITPVTPSDSNPGEGPPPPLASRDFFFPLSLYTRPAPSPPGPQLPPSSTTLPGNIATKYQDAVARVENLDAFLTPNMRCTLSSMLAVVNTHLSQSATPDNPATVPHSLVSLVASPDYSGEQIKDIVDIIENGLIAFAAVGGGSVKRSSVTGAVIGFRIRQRLMDENGIPIKSTHRSSKVRLSCILRDPTCQICNGSGSEVAHIIPYSVKDKKAIDFWKFVELFRGVDETKALKAIALAPNPENVDTLKNVWSLCKNCHDLFGHGKLAVIPDLDGLTYPFDPLSTSMVAVPSPHLIHHLAS